MAAAESVHASPPPGPSESPEVHAGQLRVAMIGNVDSGKSTLTGCLTRGVTDDGRGAARAHVFRHRHEAENGRTSSVGVEVMGFAGDDIVKVDSKAGRAKVFQTIKAESDRSITFIDLCGHEKYLKTTIFGLTGMMPDYGLVVVGGNMGVSRMTREHVGIAAALRVPLIVAVTKVDLAPAGVLKKTLASVNKLLKAARKMPYLVRTEDNVNKAASTILTARITPVFLVSNVSGQGLDMLRSLLRRLPHRVGSSAAQGGEAPAPPGLVEFSTASAAETSSEVVAPPPVPAASPVPGASPTLPPGVSPEGEAVIDSVFNVPGVGTVVAGTVVKGAITSGSTMLLGPDGTGHFQPVVVRSIHVQYTGTDVALPGGSAAFAIRPKGKGKLGGDRRKMWVKKGMALVHPALAPASSWEFEAEVLILHHQTTLGVGYAPVMHVGVVTQSARIVSMRSREGEALTTLRTGDRAIMRCRFQYRPEFVREGNALLFREGRAKGVGRITGVFADAGELSEPPGSDPSKAQAAKAARASEVAPAAAAAKSPEGRIRS